MQTLVSALLSEGVSVRTVREDEVGTERGDRVEQPPQEG